MASHQTQYDRIIAAIFEDHWQEGLTSFFFTREEVSDKARDLGLERPRNLGDVVYTYRYRKSLPASIAQTAPEGYSWIIRGAGQAQYQFALVTLPTINPSPHYLRIKIPDATPGLINMYAMSDEQALLAKLRYNRLIDIFTGLTCYSLQSHLRTSVSGIGQVETDEIYIGVDRRGVQYVIPVQAKGGTDRMGAVQIEQDFALCAAKFPTLICRCIGAQFLDDSSIAMFEFVITSDEISVSMEKHYQLVRPAELSPEELSQYRRLSD